MKERITSCMLVIMKHEKPVKDLPDVVADRLSKMEGVDGSGVEVISLSKTEMDACVAVISGDDSDLGMTDAEINKVAPLLCKGMGDNITI